MGGYYPVKFSYAIFMYIYTSLPIQPKEKVMQSRGRLVVESLSLMREAWVQSWATTTQVLEQGPDLSLDLGPYLDGAPACLF